MKRKEFTLFMFGNHMKYIRVLGTLGKDITDIQIRVIRTILNKGILLYKTCQINTYSQASSNL